MIKVAGRNHQKRPHPLAAADRGMAHRLEQLPPGIVWNRKQAVEALIDRLTHCIKGRFQTDGGVHHRGINRHRKAGGRTACRPDQAEYALRSEEHTSELQSLMRISYAVFCLKKKNNNTKNSEETSAILKNAHVQ